MMLTLTTQEIADESGKLRKAWKDQNKQIHKLRHEIAELQKDKIRIVKDYKQYINKHL